MKMKLDKWIVVGALLVFLSLGSVAIAQPQIIPETSAIPENPASPENPESPDNPESPAPKNSQFSIGSTGSPTIVLNSQFPKIGLVLGGGGAKGAAHIGVLRYLEEHNIPVHCIAGTSMGAIVGGLYALGYSAGQLDTLISNIDWDAYLGGTVDRSVRSVAARQRRDQLLFSLPVSFSPSDSARYARVNSFVGGSSLTNLFNNLSVGYQDSCSFDSLPIPFACVATDLCTGNEVVLRSGSLPQAIRSSMAIPGVFDPVTMGDKVLADGGMVNNFPVDICRAMGADIVIGVEVADSLRIDSDRLSSLSTLATQLLCIAVSGKTASNRQSCDIYIRPNIRGYSTLSFNTAAIDTLVRRGYEAATKVFESSNFNSQFPDNSQLSILNSQFPKATNLYTDTALISGISFHGVEPVEEAWLLRRAGLDEGHPVTAADLDRGVAYLTATGAYRNIVYRVRRTGNRGDTLAVIGMPNRYNVYHLDVDMQPTPPHAVGLGFRYDSEESAFLLLDLGLRRNRLSGVKLDLRARLSYNPRLYAGVSLSGFSRGTATIDYRFGRTDYTLVESDGDEQYVNYEDHRFRFFLSDYNFMRFNVLCGAQFRAMHYRSLLGDDVSFPARSANNTFAFFVHARFDNLDKPLYARKGSLVLLDLAFGADSSRDAMPSFRHNRWGAVALQAVSYLTPGDGAITVVPAMSLRWLAPKGDIYRFHHNIVGGVLPGRYVDQQMSFLGVLKPHIVGDAALILRCDLRIRLGGHHNLALIGNYLYHGEDIEQFMRFEPQYLRGEVGAALRYAYTTRFGPLSLDIASSTLHPRPQLYLSFGYNF